MHGGDDSCLGPRGWPSKGNPFSEDNIAQRIEIQIFYTTAFSFKITWREFVLDFIGKSHKFFSRILRTFQCGPTIRHNIKNVQLSLHMFFCIHHRLLLCVFCHYGIVWLDNIRCKVGNLEKLSRCYVNDVWTCWVFAGISNISPITQYKQPRLASTHMQERLKKTFFNVSGKKDIYWYKNYQKQKDYAAIMIEGLWCECMVMW